MCASVGAAFYGIGALCVLPYAICGSSCRDDEVQKTHMYLTRSAIVFDRYVYACGCCCYKHVSIMFIFFVAQLFSLSRAKAAQCRLLCTNFGSIRISRIATQLRRSARWYLSRRFKMLHFQPAVRCHCCSSCCTLLSQGPELWLHFTSLVRAGTPRASCRLC